MLNFKAYNNKKLDARFKITPNKYSEIKAKYKALKSSRKVAKIYGVSHKIILYIVNPAYKKKDTDRIKKRKPWLKYYNRESHTIAIRKYRAKKRKLTHQILKPINNKKA